MSVPYYEPHLFPETDKPQVMNDDEFWARVGRNLGFVIDIAVADDDDRDQGDER